MDCGAVSDELASSEILGHAKGAFTGATSDRPGKFEEANGGTLFLDEIGDLPLSLQPKLLRVVERGEVIRVGENHVRPVDVRLVAATHRDIRSMAAKGDFRQDLYFRIAAKTIVLPPLRSRKDDVVQIARHFVREFSALANKNVTLGPGAIESLRAYDWPGNVRELRNAMEVAVSWATGDQISETEVRMGQQDMAPPEQPGASRDRSLDEFLELPLKQAEVTFKRLYLTRVLERFDWNNAKAAKHIGYTREGVRGLRRKLGIEGPEGQG